MLTRRCKNSQKSENSRTSKVNSKFFSEICWKHDTPLQSLDIHYSSAFYSTLLSFFDLKISGTRFWVIMGQPEIARKQPGPGKKVTKPISRERMVVETWLTPQNDRKVGFSEGRQANYTHTTTASASKMHFSDFWGPYMVKS